MSRFCYIARVKWKNYAFASVIILIFIKIVLLSFDKPDKSASTYETQLMPEQIRNLIHLAEVENGKRIANIERVCRKYNLGLYRSHRLNQSIYPHPPTPQYEVFYYDTKHKLSWCPVYKAGSSSWLFNLAILGGYTEQEIKNSKIQLNTLVRKRFPELEPSEAEQVLQNSLKFMIARHPFERILSAYRDKFENMRVRDADGTYHFYNSYGSKIVSKYRSGGNKTNIREILKSDQYYWNPNEKEPIGIEPTFQEFVKYIINSDVVTRSDDHWIPYYLFCTPCLLKYDIIGKVESMLRDQLYTINRLNIQHIVFPQWRHKTNFMASTYDDNVSDMAKIYFSQLLEEEIENLYEAYKLDFDLFQYKPQQYYKYAKK